MATIIGGVLFLIPRAIIEDADQLARTHSAEPFTEAHIVAAALGHLPQGSELGIDASQLRAALEPRFSKSAHGLPSIELIDDKSRPGVRRRPTIEHLEGRAMVLSAVEPSHGLDAIDLVAAALFDPQSATSRVVTESLGLDRDEAIIALKSATERYRHVTFPPTNLTTM